MLILEVEVIKCYQSSRHCVTMVDAIELENGQKESNLIYIEMEMLILEVEVTELY
jgi:hypothetical protein